MKEEKMDRRVRKTRAVLGDVFMKLLAEKELKDISVKELTELADVNRGTFYLHYTDVYDMLDKIEMELFEEFNQILDKNLHQNTVSVYGLFKDIFDYLQDNKDAAKVLMGPHGDLAFINRMEDLVKVRLKNMPELIAPIRDDFEFIYAFIASGCIGVIEHWLNSDQSYPPEAIAKQCSDLIIRGLPSIPEPHLQTEY